VFDWAELLVLAVQSLRLRGGGDAAGVGCQGEEKKADSSHRQNAAGSE